ncbi:hypothetical protein J5X84_41460 [Streptosporangiaceae bacterium NEAU-GS5]|nr:hypothetical protein [Streptosporangiaceae bacterium NEAU-GS5]
MDSSSQSSPDECEDLSQLLSRIPEELVDDQARSFLLAGERLLFRQMGLDGGDASDPFTDVLAGISRRRVVDEAQQYASGDSLTQAGFRYRWKKMSDYRSDLVHFALRSLLLKMEYPEQMRDLHTVSPGMSTVRMIEKIAYQEVATRHENRAFRMQMAFQALFPRDEVLAQALRQVDRRQVDGWCSLYRGILEDRGLRLRPDVTIEDLTLALHLTCQVVAFRVLLGEGDGRGRYGKALDRTKETTFLGPLVLALLVGFVDPGDGRSLHEAASAILNTG